MISRDVSIGRCFFAAMDKTEHIRMKFLKESIVTFPPE
jgi:hypothetical protein